MIQRKKFLQLLLEDGALAPRLRLLRFAGKMLVPSYRFKWPQLDWWKNEEFTHYLDRFGELPVLNTDRKWMVHQLLRLVSHLPGDTAECGVFRGATSYLICCANEESQAGDKTHHLFDSFEGLSEPGPADGVHWSKGDLKCGIEHVRKALSHFARIRFYPGWIPDRFQDVADGKFSFVHIDVDLYQPTLDSLSFFYAHMNPRGIMLFDDYGFRSCPGARRAIDEFLEDKPENVVLVPTGQAFVICQPEH